ncbi:amidase [Bosea lathyri]|uniref:Aspartyl-tRNA(Asn)/glutamyl-tRNA(Gln) amidotransferase subunit A n=1 Tax=Bosea lathyri TaxID=1036778 RepID=A0A1H5RYI9_9HYPH|nr:amidase [Bosea lathyri]SEF43416.1 aspartyl-tRNA(Asn)/glutamyl-tRNA(Gln) amidotransferase subunit A [Bosea lathyri]
MRTLQQCAEDLASGGISSRALVEDCLERIADPKGEGARAFISVSADSARAAADAHDALRRAGREAGPFAGIPFAVKDLFDVAGERSMAGSRALAEAKPARQHAPVIARMIAAGFIPIGRTNMTEFAYSGIGANPHYGTPLSPWDKQARRIPGGSSSGSAVAVADGMATVALGSDTGGSCRIPAALCGITGYKPTARRVPLAGVVPLSQSLDSIGPLGASVACCAIVDGVLAGETPVSPAVRPLSGLRLAIPTQIVRDGMDQAVSAAFDRAVARLSAQGALITEVDFAPLSEIGKATSKGGFAAPEAYAWHRALLAAKGDLYDPRVCSRIATGAQIIAADYLDLVAARRTIIAAMDALTLGYDAVLMPTCPIIAPRIDELTEDAEYFRLNGLLLRNPSLGNFLDRCAISLPCHKPGDAPVGLTLMGETGTDRALFAIAAAVEAALRP